MVPLTPSSVAAIPSSLGLAVGLGVGDGMGVAVGGAGVATWAEELPQAAKTTASIRSAMVRFVVPSPHLELAGSIVGIGKQKARGKRQG
jgi:hypothetical protein